MWWLKSKKKEVITDDRQRFRLFYLSTDWQKLRLFKLANNPLCEQCEREGRITPARAVDHVIPLAVDWSLRLDYDNLQSLCDYTSPFDCHGKKTKTVDYYLKRDKAIDDNMDELNEFE
jgi:5-methylcytosine-specific restriction protein A